MSGVFACRLGPCATIGGEAASPRPATHGPTVKSTRTNFPFIAPLQSNGPPPQRCWAPVVGQVVGRIADRLPSPQRRLWNRRATTAPPDGLIRPAHALRADGPLSLPSSCALRTDSPPRLCKRRQSTGPRLVAHLPECVGPTHHGRWDRRALKMRGSVRFTARACKK